MTSIVERAAASLLSSIEGYLSFDPTDTTTKFIPVDYGEEERPATVAAAVTAQQFLEHVPFVVAERAKQEKDRASNDVMLFLAEVVAAHLRRYEAAVAPNVSGSTGASHRGAWIAWVVLSVFKTFAAEAAADAPNWDMTRYQRLEGAVRDVLERRQARALGMAATPTAVDVSLLREIDEAAQQLDVSDGTDLFSRHQHPFTAFLRDVVCPAASEEDDDASTTLEILFPFHRFASGQAARVVVSALLDSASEDGELHRLVERVRGHLAAHESCTQSLAQGTRNAGAGDNIRGVTHRHSAAACAYRDAIRHGLGLITAAIQVVATNVFADEEVLGAIGGGGEGASSVPGAWLVGHTHRRGQRRPLRVQHLLPSRLCVLLPGLCIAATEVLAADSHASTTSSGSCSATPHPSLDAMVPASTVLVSPLQARRGLVWAPSEEEKARGVALVPPSRLSCVAALYLFTDLPPMTPSQARGAGELAELSWWDSFAQEVRSVTTGLVLVVVQSSPPKEAARHMEGWGTASRTVVMVTAVGEWGLTQLALRFDRMPTVGSGDRSRSGRWGAVTGSRAGVLLVALDETSRVLQLESPARASAAWSFVETRRRMAVVVGESWGEAPAPAGKPVSMRPDPESSSSSGSEGECFVPPPLPALPHTQRSLLVGGVTPLQQTERLVAFYRVWESAVHRRVLPWRLSRGAAGGTARGVELAVLTKFEEYLASPGEARVQLRSTKENVRDEDTKRFRMRAATALREAIWQYLLVCEHRWLGGGPVEEAWASLRAQGEGHHCTSFEEKDRPGEDVDTNRSPSYRETYLQIRAAYLTVGRCLDELCTTALLLNHGARRAGEAGAAQFAPIVR